MSSKVTRTKLPSILELYDEGTRLLIEEGDKREKEKVGFLRAGNTGLLQSGEVTGKCHRLSFLRMKGIQVEEAEPGKELMFAAGRGNEDLWMDVLNRVWTADKGVIRREEEIPINWKTENGTPVSGRPDVVLCDTNGSPVKGIELKLVSSLWTARDVLSGKPKPMHLMQAAHYAWQLGVPFELWYTSRANYAVTGDWVKKLFPKEGGPGSDACTYNDKGDIKSVVPFKRGFYLRFTDAGFLQTKAVEEGPESEDSGWKGTIVTIQRIKDYFNYVDTMESTKTLGKRPKNLNADGSDGNFKACDYCPLKQHCDTYEAKGFDQWLSNIPRLTK